MNLATCSRGSWRKLCSPVVEISNSQPADTGRISFEPRGILTVCLVPFYGPERTAAVSYTYRKKAFHDVNHCTFEISAEYALIYLKKNAFTGGLRAARLGLPTASHGGAS